MVLGNRVWSVSKFKSFEKYSTVVIYDKVPSYQTIEIFGSKILKKISKILLYRIPEKFLSYCHFKVPWQSVPIY